jgi:hypothetical protein
MDVFNFISPFALVFLFAVLVLAYLIKRAFSDEILDPETVARELYPIADDDVRFERHKRIYLLHKKVFGEGRIEHIHIRDDGRTVMTLTSDAEISDDDTSKPQTFLIALLFFGGDAPTEAQNGEWVSFRGILRDVRVEKNIITQTIEISELLYVGKEPEDDSDDSF